MTATARLHLALLAFGVAVSAPASAGSGSLAEVVEHMISAYGGEENLHKLDSVVQEWDLLALTRNQQGSDKRSIRLPGQLKVELTYPDKHETRILDGDTGYAVFGDREPAAANTMQTGAMRLQLMRFYSPLTLRDRSDAIEVAKEKGHLVLTLRENGLRADYVVDTDSWRIVKVIGTLAINGATMQFVTEYSEFAMVEGVLVHQRENKFVGGMNTAVLRLQRVTVDAALDDDDFQPRKNPADPVIARVESTTAL